MRTTMLGCVIGVCCLQWMPWLPPALGLWVGFAVGLAGLLWGQGSESPTKLLAVFLAGILIGFSWAGLRAEWRLSESLPATLQGQDIRVSGVIVGLPERYEDGSQRFMLRVEEASAAVPSLIQLSWYVPRTRERAAEHDLPTLRPGERWRWTVRLRRPHGFINPHGFDYEAWLLAKGIRATGYVRSLPAPERIDIPLDGGMSMIHRWRDHIRQRFHSVLGERSYAGILVALAMGDQRSIPEAQWRVLRETGVAHLVSISGLHVSLVALLAGTLSGGVWRRVPRLMLWHPAQSIAICSGLLAATVYALLAGMALPTLRAWVMLLVLALAWLSGRLTRPSRTLAQALCVVMIIDPWCVLSAGFWLSFGAMGAILYVVGGRADIAERPAWRNGLRVQLAITALTMPLLVLLFNAFPVVSPLANAVAIPVVSFVVTPLVLLAVFVPWDWPLSWAHWVLTGLIPALEWMAGWPFALWQQAALPSWLGGIAVLACIVLLLPRGTPGRWAALIALLPAVLWSPARPLLGEARVTVLDVGNGTSVHIQTATHDVMYDTGPRYGASADAAQRVIVPYLRAAGARKLQGLVLSHEDADHIGGAERLLTEFTVDTLWSDLPSSHPVRAHYVGDAHACHTRPSWNWDGVQFTVLSGAAEAGSRRIGNNQSCVLHVQASGGSVLLPGDLERQGERALVQSDGAGLRSEVVLAAHHGSATSSSAAFIQATRAQHVIFTVGYLNPFRHPHQAVVKRWQETGAHTWRTDLDGALTVHLSRTGLQITRERELQRRYWHGR